VTPAVELDGVVKRYGALAAVDGVSLAAVHGERLALVGHNGAGKTTLLKLLLGLIAPGGGRVRTLGEDPAGSRGPAVRRAVGFLPEAVRFDEAMTGEAVVAFYARLKGVPPRDGVRLLEQLGLGAAARRRIGTYSKGMRQRVGLAQAFMGEPRLLLLDEPTSGLDPELRAAFYGLVDERRRQGAAVLLSTHALGEIEDRVERLAVLDRGRLVAAGDLAEIRRQTGLPFTLRVRVPPCRTAELAGRLGAGVECRRIDERTLAVTCPPAAKMDVLRRLAAERELALDIEVLPPGLDELYRHLLAGHQP
jgi:Cu-processing system ATP-binding protein